VEAEPVELLRGGLGELGATRRTALPGAPGLR
jgi:hypothetical protein